MKSVAIAQVESSTDKQTNLRKATSLIREARAKGAECVAFPEFLMAFSPASQSAAELARMAEPADGPFISSLCETAGSENISVLATIYETAALPNRVYDTAVWIDARGKIASVYRKLHLYDAFGFKESDKFHPGDEIGPLISDKDSRCGVMICYDLRFPEMARMLAIEGANMMFAPSGWVQGDLKVEHWQTMIKARALENGCYVIAPDQAGNIYIGHSMIADPLGRVVVDLGEKEDMKVIDLDFSLVEQTREKLPLLKNRRAEIYSRHASHKSGRDI